MPAYECRHIVGFGETSLVGNAYFSHYLEWQGMCRERFLREHAPEIVELLNSQKVAFFTARCSCDYLVSWGFGALDEVVIRMRLERFRGGRMALVFEYVDEREPERIVARGTQEVHCKSKRGDQWVPTPFPPPMLRALMGFAEGAELRSNLQEALDFQESGALSSGVAGEPRGQGGESHDGHQESRPEAH